MMKWCNAVMKLFIFLLLTQCKCRKVNMVKVKINHAMRKSKYGLLPMLPYGEGSDFKVFRTGLCWRRLLHSSCASSGLRDGYLDGCTSCDGDSDNVIFSFHTCLVYGLDFGRVGSSFTTSLGSSSSSHPLFGGWFFWHRDDWHLLLERFFFGCS